MLTGQRAFLSAVDTSAGRVLAVPVAQVRQVVAHEPGLSDLILRTFLLRHSILMSRGTGLTLIGSRFDPDTRWLLEVLARNRLVWNWLDLETSPEAEQILQGLDVPVGDLPIIIVPGGLVRRNPAAARCWTRWPSPATLARLRQVCATCWSWAQARPGSRPRSTARPPAWRQHWRKTPRLAAKRAPRHVSRTTSVFPQACPGRNSPPAVVNPPRHPVSAAYDRANGNRAKRADRGSTDAIAATKALVREPAREYGILIIRRSWVRSPPAVLLARTKGSFQLDPAFRLPGGHKRRADLLAL
jgi:hypothetical protein